MPSIKDIKLPEGEKDALLVANREVLRLQNKITLNIKDGTSFPALVEIQRLKNLEDPTGSGVYKDLARSQAKVKMDEVTRLVSDMETLLRKCCPLVRVLIQKRTWRQLSMK